MEAMKNYLIAERNMWLFNVLIPLHTWNGLRNKYSGKEISQYTRISWNAWLMGRELWA